MDGLDEGKDLEADGVVDFPGSFSLNLLQRRAWSAAVWGNSLGMAWPVRWQESGTPPASRFTGGQRAPEEITAASRNDCAAAGQII